MTARLGPFPIGTSYLRCNAQSLGAQTPDGADIAIPLAVADLAGSDIELDGDGHTIRILTTGVYEVGLTAQLSSEGGGNIDSGALFLTGDAPFDANPGANFLFPNDGPFGGYWQGGIGVAPVHVDADTAFVARAALYAGTPGASWQIPGAQNLLVVTRLA